MKKYNLYEINDVLEKKLRKLVNHHIRKDCRDEAMEILLNSDEKTIKDFLFFGMSDNGNLACLTLDNAKDENGNRIKTKNFGNLDFFD